MSQSDHHSHTEKPWVQRPYRWAPDDRDTSNPYVPIDTDRPFDDDPERPDHPHAEDDEQLDSSLFKEEIQRDPEICSSCFLKNYDVVHPYSHRTSLRRRFVRYFVPSGDTTQAIPQAGIPTRNPPRACECGRLGPLRSRPLSKEHAIEAAWHLSRTLAQKGIEHDPLLLVATVLSRKTAGGNQSMRDDSNFAVAVERSLLHTEYSMDDWLTESGTQPALPSGE
ncbi:hypothetical protein [Halocatena marina]|uniref:hypothetical protein n=1 Tax=Halocatena marina TaxID=2934937 RepID=UPI00200DB5A4|nr:hypothetical protein [Halocatena marina]